MTCILCVFLKLWKVSGVGLWWRNSECVHIRRGLDEGSEWGGVMRDFNKCAWKYILHWHWPWPWALDRWCGNSWCEHSPKLNPPSTVWAETWGLSLQSLSIVLAPRQPGFRKRKLFPSFSFQAVCSFGDQDCHIKVYEKLFHWNSGTTVLHGLLINGGSYVLFHAFHQVAWAEWGSPTMPWGPLCRFTFLSLWLFGVPSQPWQNRGMFINNQDTPLGWAHDLVCWMRLPSDVIHLSFSCSCSVVQSCPALCYPMAVGCQAPPSFNDSQSSLKLMSVESVMPSNHLILCRPLRLLPSIFPSNRVFSNESALCIKWPRYWSFSFSINPSNEYSELISFRMDWFDLLAVQGTLKSLLQHHTSRASILWCPAIYMVQLSHPYMTLEKP